MSNKEWTLEDYDFLYKNYNKMSAQAIAEKLQRSVSSVQSHAEKLGLFQKAEFSQQEMNTARLYKRQLGTALIFLLPECSTAMVEELMECVK